MTRTHLEVTEDTQDWRNTNWKINTGNESKVPKCVGWYNTQAIGGDTVQVIFLSQHIKGPFHPGCDSEKLVQPDRCLHLFCFFRLLSSTGSFSMFSCGPGNNYKYMSTYKRLHTHTHRHTQTHTRERACSDLQCMVVGDSVDLYRSLFQFCKALWAIIENYYINVHYYYYSIL